MAEIVGSAVVTEAVSRISSILSGDKRSHESVEDKAERLEMAVLKIRSVVAVSEDHHISHPPLLRWKAKLKRVAEEGDDLLHLQHKKQALECDGKATGNSVSQYLTQAARRFVPFRRKEAELLDDNTLRRFERVADGADSFFRLVESGGRPRKSMFLPSLTRSLLAGDSMEFSIRRRSGGDGLIMLWPWLDPGIGNGLEACLAVSHEDEVMWEKNLKICVVFRLSEASDILAIAMGCLELLPPQFDTAGVAIRRMLTETIGQRSDSSNLSERSIWCRRHIQSHCRYDCEASTGYEHRGTRKLLPHPVLQLTASCYASPSIGRSSSPMKDGLPLELVCHVSPCFLSEKYSEQFELDVLHGWSSDFTAIDDGAGIPDGKFWSPFFGMSPAFSCHSGSHTPKSSYVIEKVLKMYAHLLIYSLQSQASDVLNINTVSKTYSYNIQEQP